MDIRHHSRLRHGDRLYASLSVAKYRGVEREGEGRAESGGERGRDEERKGGGEGRRREM